MPPLLVCASSPMHQEQEKQCKEIYIRVPKHLSYLITKCMQRYEAKVACKKIIKTIINLVNVSQTKLIRR